MSHKRGEFPEEVRMDARFRSRGNCEAKLKGCRGKANQFHHRQLRRHGNNTLANCLHVCSACHADIHSMGSAAYLMGLLVHSWDDPADVPVKR